jgi:hemerythrin superfamily protein
VPLLEAAIGADRASEIRRAIGDIVAIARDRYGRLTAAGRENLA